jgi:cleavage and polyadenylation specificity factor subunit 3
VSKDYSYTLLDPRDLKDFAGLSSVPLVQRQRIKIGVRWELVKWHLEGMFGSVEEDIVDSGEDGTNEEGVRVMRVGVLRLFLIHNFLTCARSWAQSMSNTPKNTN